MALKRIKVQPQGTEAYTPQLLTLERRQWLFEFYQNSVIDLWFWDLTNDAGEVVVRGEGLSLGVDLLAKFRALDIPPGYLFVVETGEGTGGEDPDTRAFSEGRAALLYLESS